MNWNFLIWFGISFGVYLLGLVIWSIIKRKRIKNQIEHEDEVIDDEEVKK